MTDTVYLLKNNKLSALRLATPAIGVGADGTVYRIKALPYQVCKVFHPTNSGAGRIEKLRAMLDNAPETVYYNKDIQQYIKIAWPNELVYDQQRRAIGYLMPLVDTDLAVHLETLFTRKSRLVYGLPEEYRFRIEVARHLASAVAEIHERKHYLIDLKPANIAVYRKKPFVALLDCDGYNIYENAKHRFPAQQFTENYIAPEALQTRASPEQLGEPQDLFALAVVIFRLFNLGLHPYQGTPNESDTSLDAASTRPGTINDHVRQDRFAYAATPDSILDPSIWSIHSYFEQTTRDLFERAFGSNEKRPTAREWEQHVSELLDPAADKLIQCDTNPEHSHFSPGCGLCAIDEYGASDAVLQQPGSSFISKLGSALLHPFTWAKNTGNALFGSVVRFLSGAPLRNWSGRKTFITVGALVVIAIAVLVFFQSYHSTQRRLTHLATTGELSVDDIYKIRVDKPEFNWNFVDSRGNNLAHLIARHPNKHTLLYDLNERGINVNRANHEGTTPLFEAVLHNRMVNMITLIKIADPNHIDNQGNNLIDTINRCQSCSARSRRGLKDLARSMTGLKKGNPYRNFAIQWSALQHPAQYRLQRYSTLIGKTCQRCHFNISADNKTMSVAREVQADIKPHMHLAVRFIDVRDFSIPGRGDRYSLDNKKYREKLFLYAGKDKTRYRYFLGGKGRHLLMSNGSMLKAFDFKQFRKIWEKPLHFDRLRFDPYNYRVAMHKTISANGNKSTDDTRIWLFDLKSGKRLFNLIYPIDHDLIGVDFGKGDNYLHYLTTDLQNNIQRTSFSLDPNADHTPWSRKLSTHRTTLYTFKRFRRLDHLLYQNTSGIVSATSLLPTGKGFRLGVGTDKKPHASYHKRYQLDRDNIPWRSGNTEKVTGSRVIGLDIDATGNLLTTAHCTRFSTKREQLTVTVWGAKMKNPLAFYAQEKCEVKAIRWLPYSKGKIALIAKDNANVKTYLTILQLLEPREAGF